MKEERLKEPALDEFYHRVHGPSKAFGVTQSSQRLIRKVGQSVLISFICVGRIPDLCFNVDERMKEEPIYFPERESSTQ
jgi:hypothetical protein